MTRVGNDKFQGDIGLHLHALEKAHKAPKDRVENLSDAVKSYCIENGWNDENVDRQEILRTIFLKAPMSSFIRAGAGLRSNFPRTRDKKFFIPDALPELSEAWQQLLAGDDGNILKSLAQEILSRPEANNLDEQRVLLRQKLRAHKILETSTEPHARQLEQQFMLAAAERFWQDNFGDASKVLSLYRSHHSNLSCVEYQHFIPHLLNTIASVVQETVDLAPEADLWPEAVARQWGKAVGAWNCLVQDVENCRTIAKDHFASMQEFYEEFFTTSPCLEIVPEEIRLQVKPLLHPGVAYSHQVSLLDKQSEENLRLFDIIRRDNKNDEDRSLKSQGSIPEQILKLISAAKRNFKNDSNVRPFAHTLLAGPSGSGKTTIARIVAAELGFVCGVLSGDDFASKYQHESANRLTSILAGANTMATLLNSYAIVIMDEMDTWTMSRQSATQEERQICNALMTALSKERESKFNRLIVIGTSNYPENMDQQKARLQIINIPAPTVEQIEQQIRNTLRTKPHSVTDDQFRTLAQLALGTDRHTLERSTSSAILEGISGQEPLVTFEHLKAALVPSLQNILKTPHDKVVTYGDGRGFKLHMQLDHFERDYKAGGARKTFEVDGKWWSLLWDTSGLKIENLDEIFTPKTITVKLFSRLNDGDSNTIVKPFVPDGNPGSAAILLDAKVLPDPMDLDFGDSFIQNNQETSLVMRISLRLQRTNKVLEPGKVNRGLGQVDRVTAQNGTSFKHPTKVGGADFFLHAFNNGKCDTPEDAKITMGGVPDLKVDVWANLMWKHPSNCDRVYRMEAHITSTREITSFRYVGCFSISESQRLHQVMSRGEWWLQVAEMKECDKSSFDEWKDNHFLVDNIDQDDASL